MHAKPSHPLTLRSQQIGWRLPTTLAQYGRAFRLATDTPARPLYQMPYSWYYGNDGFIANLVDRHVLVPSAQGYSIVSTMLLSASVHLEASALLADAWTEASRLLQALGTPLGLVPGDIASNFYDRDIASPAALAASLAQDPNMRILYAETVHSRSMDPARGILRPQVSRL